MKRDPAAAWAALRGFPAAAVPRRLSPLTSIRVPDDLAAVTSIAPDEVDPVDVGMDAGSVDRIWEGVERLYGTAMNQSIALCIRREGEVILDRAIGHVTGNEPDADPEAEKVPVHHTTPFLIASASKSVTAMCIHLLDQRDQLHIEDRVADYIPEFARHGKDTITIGHVLSHKAGVPNIPPEALDLEYVQDPDHALQIMIDAKPFHQPGRLVAYHAISGGFVLAEIIKRVTGKPVKQFLEEEILQPLKFERMTYGTPAADVPLVAKGHSAGFPVLPPMSQFFERALGKPLPELNELLNDPRVFAGVIPSGNIVASAREASRFFELLRVGGTLDGVEIFEPRTIRRAITEQSYMQIDFALGFPFRYAYGFMLGAKVFSLYGPETHWAFGHLGYVNTICWADPERKVSGAFLLAGKPIIGPHLYPLWNVMRTITTEAPRDGLADSPLVTEG
ncbi:MAG: serine hydrolase domain-containing protein [Nitriliruptorales bacterium]|nr:serine hydrolase domain-containing protein [Nitriliruptorales bacterium]